MPEILDHLAGSHMAFITAGMGGGTGTGAAPVIARAAKEQGILTVGVVTKPFHFEGIRRQQTAERGIELLAKHVDTLIVIPNQNLFRVANEKTTFAAAFAMADQVLYSGVASITELMTKEGLINLDFADVRAIMSEMGRAMMGTGEATGEKRAIEAAEAAISNPLLDDVSMRGARGLLISITGGPDLTLYEVDEAATRIREEVDPEANIILGATFDESLEGTMRVSVVATGLASEAGRQSEPAAEDKAEPEETGRAVFGFTGKQPTPVKKHAQPAPMAARATVQQAQPPQHSHDHYDAEEEADMVRAGGGGSRHRANSPGPCAFRRSTNSRRLRSSRWRRSSAASRILPIMPAARRRACSSVLPVSALAARTSRRRSRNASRPWPAQPRPQQVAPIRPQAPAEQHRPEPALDDDQLEIPAFLRRQAN